MKLLIALLLFSHSVDAQVTDVPEMPHEALSLESITLTKEKKSIRLAPEKWRMTGNCWVTGGLVFLAGASKGFNETLMFHWKSFRHAFPEANPRWFNPDESWRNKYKNGDPNAGAKFPLSTSALVMFTDQYHLNTFINRVAWTSTIVIKIGEGRKPLKHYLMDFVYYTFCHQAGFALTYYPFKNYKGQ